MINIATSDQPINCELKLTVNFSHNFYQSKPLRADCCYDWNVMMFMRCNILLQNIIDLEKKTDLASDKS